MTTTNFTVLNWNIGGAKYLETPGEEKRDEIRMGINKSLKSLIERYHYPDVITLQEVVKFGETLATAEETQRNAMDIIKVDDMKNMLDDHGFAYTYNMFPLIDTLTVSNQDKWDKVKKLGGWDDNTYFAQGNSILIKTFPGVYPIYPVWSLKKNNKIPPKKFGDAIGDVNEIHPNKQEHMIEKVNLDSGLYFGDRDTEPRAALIAHIILNPNGKDEKPLDIFVVNLHLTTIMKEREGIPQKDKEATEIRLVQLDTIFNGIVSRYNLWKQNGYPNRGEDREIDANETKKRNNPVWILAGDFNFTQESEEYERIMRMNFIDLVPNKGSGTKAKGVGENASLTLDYIFAGPKFISLDPFVTGQGINDNGVDHQIKESDHYPIYAKVPISIPD